MASVVLSVYGPMNPQPAKSGAKYDKDTFNSKAILLVDDDRQLVEALQWILGEANVQVDVAYDGEEALAKVKERKYDAVVCDVVMPKKDGPRFHAEATELFPELSEKFMFITGHPEDPKSWSFLTCSQSKYLVKPFPMEDFIGEVKKTISENKK